MSGVPKWVGRYIVTADIKLLTGLHISVGKEDIEVGGLDSVVVKTPDGKPYIPGSSLKGKMRTLMEFYEGKVSDDGVIHSCKEENCPVCGLFGRAIGKEEKEQKKKEQKKEEAGKNVFNRTRLIVRDAYLDENSLKAFKAFLEMGWVEIKAENFINRITAKATPRHFERVPAGAVFKAEFVVNIYNGDNDLYLKKLLTAMQLLEDDYLGGSGSRGYGKIKFENIVIKKREASYYEGNKAGECELVRASDVKEALERLNKAECKQ